ncbi:PLC-like phosphodiesterase [Paraphoma chrysanthemicola]|uniref:PLC-like phosphodiesterase n=1 Tax=Paraphoma chrysanthemicola TaxID=798071 RepID=A0A8K0QYI8_9PLEO|nr:PLC-like phosphodiesterase [Paraphoma chrysanthemicola]
MWPVCLALGVLVSVVFGEERACNNAPALCKSGYDKVTYLGAHNSPFVRDISTGWSSFGNQYFNTTVQLDAGVRLLTAQVHAASNPETKARELRLCHSTCVLFDVGLFKDWLWEIRTWLDAHPNEVVTLVLVNFHFVDAREIEGEFARADIAHYGYVPANITAAPPPSSEFNKTWPTLGEMIDRGERLVTFINALVPDKENAPYLLNEFDFVWENAYDVTSPSQFACTPDRPSNTTSIADARSSGKLFFLNHLLYWQQAFGIKLPDTRTIAETNAWDGNGGLGKHVRECANQVGRQPTFVLVDFFNVGAAMKVVDAFNKVRNPRGRIEASEKIMDVVTGQRRVSESSRGFAGRTMALVVAIAMVVVTL